MRILFCNYEYPPLGGGGGVVMAALARHLARRHEVTVLTSRAGDPTTRACTSCACLYSFVASWPSRTFHRC
jgi:glycine/D-amino acid oxidase-like deaminating enzyme